jgi:hypothetical protein
MLHVKLERCKVKGCGEPVMVTRNPNGTTKIRYCGEHLPNSQVPNVQSRKTADIAGLLSLDVYATR